MTIKRLRKLLDGRRMDLKRKILLRIWEYLLVEFSRYGKNIEKLKKSQI
ncbi:hypothetical protein ACO3TA_03015 [Methanocaldococcus sp. 28A]